MADRVLPSRDAEYWPAFVTMLEEEGLDGAATVFEAWWSGRLVDREAFDYEAATRRLCGLKLAEALQWWGQRLDGESFSMDEWAAAVVDAALPDLEV